MQTPKPVQQMSAEEALGTYFLMSALSGKAGASDFLTTVYPIRAQIVTFAIIGFHRDRGTWPENAEALLHYAQSSPANPPLPAEALAGLTLAPKPDGGIDYSTTEDRQRGRVFSISSTHRVSFPVPSYAFANPNAQPAPMAKNTTIGFDWTSLIAEAIARAALMKK
ncbi:MAG: hypothetical protein HZA31_14130 [Opitutae bacterium]|nr:hypothetical protein [Opitutae bacterium]